MKHIIKTFEKLHETIINRLSNIWTRVYNLGNRLRVSYLIAYSHICHIFTHALHKSRLLSCVRHLVHQHMGALMGVNRITNGGPYLLLNNELELYF